MVLWAMLEISRCVANNKSMCSEDRVVKVFMVWQKATNVFGSYVGGSGDETIDEEWC